MLGQPFPPRPTHHLPVLSVTEQLVPDVRRPQYNTEGGRERGREGGRGGNYLKYSGWTKSKNVFVI